MKKKDWMAKNGINPKVFYRWQQKLRMEIGTDMILSQQNKQATVFSEPVQFEPVISPDISNRSLCGTVTVRCGAVNIEVNENITDSFLKRLIRVMSHV